MAINDPYDRSGQYAEGDRGAKLDNYSATAPDRRDVAVGTMMGEGGRESRQGYAGILDSIENRASAIMGGANYGTRGNSDLDSIVKARGGAEYNAWSPSRGGAAYGTATRGAQGTPRPGRESDWYDQAMEVYDDYYGNPDADYRGITQGATFYQNDSALNARQRAPQEAMRVGGNALTIGAHTFTGPGFQPTRTAAVDYPDYGFHSTPPQGRPQAMAAALTGWDMADLMAPAVDDMLGPPPQVVAFSGIEDPMAPGAYGYGTPTETVMGTGSTALLGSLIGPLPAPAPLPVAAGPAPGTPGYGIIGGTGRGSETGQRADGTVADFGGAYGGFDAFGPNDPFGGWGFGDYGPGVTVDVMDVALGDTGYSGPGNGGGSLGDGSYSESSGRNDNNPQGIL